jgi:hypothetical protein
MSRVKKCIFLGMVTACWLCFSCEKSAEDANQLDSNSKGDIAAKDNNQPFCPDGEVVEGSSTFFASSEEGKECKTAELHCVTKEAKACPQLSPPDPNWCSDGMVVAGAPSFIPSTDGKECQVPNLHCISKVNKACPQLSPPDPNWCSDGEVASGMPTFFTATDGKECISYNRHCLTKNSQSCPQK